MDTATTAEPFWSRPAPEILAALETSKQGLSSPAARERLKRDGANSVVAEDHMTGPRLLLRQFESPLVLILIFGACVSLFLREWTDATIILTIVFGSIALGFYQEYRASKAVQALRSRLALTTRAMRDGTLSAVPASTLVRGDIILLAAGNLVPADALFWSRKIFSSTKPV
jgi:Mg2+-importing ATPase